MLACICVPSELSSSVFLLISWLYEVKNLSFWLALTSRGHSTCILRVRFSRTGSNIGLKERIKLKTKKQTFLEHFLSLISVSLACVDTCVKLYIQHLPYVHLQHTCKYGVRKYVKKLSQELIEKRNWKF
jgi:hypothetical protein